ncbi:MAG: hypothetical protein HQL19_05830, partial [Candidatus Omnitrophica bacterium]|nr:hypothetical protein [Candidatus Omnitrophota bacterium]
AAAQEFVRNADTILAKAQHIIANATTYSKKQIAEANYDVKTMGVRFNAAQEFLKNQKSTARNIETQIMNERIHLAASALTRAVLLKPSVASIIADQLQDHHVGYRLAPMLKMPGWLAKQVLPELVSLLGRDPVAIHAALQKAERYLKAYELHEATAVNAWLEPDVVNVKLAFLLAGYQFTRRHVVTVNKTMDRALEVMGVDPAMAAPQADSRDYFLRELLQKYSKEALNRAFSQVMNYLDAGFIDHSGMLARKFLVLGKFEKSSESTIREDVASAIAKRFRLEFVVIPGGQPVHVRNSFGSTILWVVGVRFLTQSKWNTEKQLKKLAADIKVYLTNRVATMDADAQSAMATKSPEALRQEYLQARKDAYGLQEQAGVVQADVGRALRWSEELKKSGEVKAAERWLRISEQRRKDAQVLARIADEAAKLAQSYNEVALVKIERLKQVAAGIETNYNAFRVRQAQDSQAWEDGVNSLFMARLLGRYSTQELENILAVITAYLPFTFTMRSGALLRNTLILNVLQDEASAKIANDVVRAVAERFNLELVSVPAGTAVRGSDTMVEVKYATFGVRFKIDSPKFNTQAQLETLGGNILSFLLARNHELLEMSGNSESAMAVDGGINLDRANLNLGVTKDGHGVEMNFDPAMAAEIREKGVSGLVPVILKITPVINILPLLGMNAEEQTLVSAS